MNFDVDLLARVIIFVGSIICGTLSMFFGASSIEAMVIGLIVYFGSGITTLLEDIKEKI